jgi:hypothetical protein
MRLFTLHKLFNLLIWAKSSEALPWVFFVGLCGLSADGNAGERGRGFGVAPNADVCVFFFSFFPHVFFGERR